MTTKVPPGFIDSEVQVGLSSLCVSGVLDIKDWPAKWNFFSVCMT